MKFQKGLIKRIVGWSIVVVVVSSLALLLYCISLFRELEPLMASAMTTKPSLFYSDYYVLKEGQRYDETFLTERLKDLKVHVVEKTEDSKTTIEWKAGGFHYPANLVAEEDAIKPNEGALVRVEVEENKIEKIEVEGSSTESLIIEPVAIAQVSGTNKSIRDYVELSQIPAKLLQSIIAIEDQRFLEHSGFDPRSFVRALVVNLKNRALSQGGSTLTQQLVKNLLQTRQKTVFRKVKELVLAVLMEARYSKDVILEKYLNEVYFGQIGSLEVHGVSEAARYFYDKRLGDLTLSEMALIAGVIRGPAVYSPYKYADRALERKNTVLKKMRELDIITESELKISLNEKIKFAPPTQVNNKAPYFADYAKSQILEQVGGQITEDDLNAGGLKVFTTADLSLQRRADKVVLAGVRDVETRYKLGSETRVEGLLVAANPSNGFIRAVVGGRSYSETTFNRVLNMKRQVGSTFKPIAYLSAFLKGEDRNGKKYSPAYMVDDEPWKYTYLGGESKNSEKKYWAPKNYEKNYRGHITLREAFANSINIPMAKIGIDVGAEAIAETAAKMGIKSNVPKVASLSLGVAELGAVELLQVYSTFANEGVRVEVTSVRLIEDEEGKLVRFVPRNEKVFEKPVMQLINDLLRSVVTEGTAKAMSAFGYVREARGKTGTTNFSRDAWFAGFSEDLVAVSWVGFEDLKLPNTDNEDDEQDAAKKFKSPALLTGAGAALPIWARFFATAKPGTAEPKEVDYDSSLEFAEIDRQTGLLAKSSCPQNQVRREMFLEGTKPDKECNVH